MHFLLHLSSWNSIGSHLCQFINLNYYQEPEYVKNKGQLKVLCAWLCFMVGLRSIANHCNNNVLIFTNIWLFYLQMSTLLNTKSIIFRFLMWAIVLSFVAIASLMRILFFTVLVASELVIYLTETQNLRGYYNTLLEGMPVLLSYVHWVQQWVMLSRHGIHYFLQLGLRKWLTTLKWTW